MNSDTILYLDERATRQACRHFDPAGVVAAAHRQALEPALSTPTVVAIPGDPRLTVLVDQWLWLDACLISSAYLAGLRIAATAAAVAGHLLDGAPLTLAVLGGTSETVEAVIHTLPNLIHLSVAGVRPGHGLPDVLRREGVRVTWADDTAEAVFGANFVVCCPPTAIPYAALARDAVVLAEAGSLRLPALLAAPGPADGVRPVALDDGGVAATTLAAEVYRAAVRLNLGVRLPR